MGAINVTEIRDLVYQIIQTDVCKNVYLDTLPSAVSKTEKANGLVMLDFESSIQDLNAFGYGIIRIWLCVHNSDRGAIMGKLENAFNDTFKAYNSSLDASHIELSPRLTFFDTIPASSLKCCIKELRVKIK